MEQDDLVLVERQNEVDEGWRNEWLEMRVGLA
jgi:hypothetical protein